MRLFLVFSQTNFLLTKIGEKYLVLSCGKLFLEFLLRVAEQKQLQPLNESIKLRLKKCFS